MAIKKIITIYDATYLPVVISGFIAIQLYYRQILL